MEQNVCPPESGRAKVIPLQPFRRTQNFESHYESGRQYREQGRLDLAIREWQRAAALDKTNLEVRLDLGVVLAEKGQLEPAAQCFRSAIELDPTHAMARCRRGICYYHRKEYEPALADLQRAYALDPDIHNIGRYVQMAVKAMRRTGR